MRNPARAARILKMLQHGTAIARAEFMDRLEISAATFKRDLEFLRDEQNAPIFWSAEHRGYMLISCGSDITAREVIPGTWFDRSELLALIAIQQILEQIEPRVLQDALLPLRKRSAALLNGAGEAGEALRQALTRIKVLPMHRRAVDDTLFQRVVSALVARKQIEVVSRDRHTSARTQRMLSPQRIVCYRDNWYVDAWCHLREALRTFSLDTLSNAHVSNHAATEMDGATLDEQLGASYGIFSGTATHTATLRFDSRVAGWIANEQWHPRQTLFTRPSGEVELTFPFGNATELVRDILKWGPDVEVIAPATLREQVGDAAKATAKRYF
jgi:predicted DNA-binding transcriptional regulator YafY